MTDRMVFDSLRPELERVCDELIASLNRELELAAVRLASPIISRIKSWDSILGKLDRGVGGLKDFREYWDLIGLRVVVPFKTDLHAASKAIRASCSVKKTFSTERRLSDESFGYVASHFIVRARGGMDGEQRKFEPSAEIQLMTAAQNVWAKASHVLQYKSSDSSPPGLHRSVSRIAALLELVDLEFERLLQERETYRRSIEMENDELVLDVDVLEVALRELWPSSYPYDPTANGMVLEALQRHGVRRLGELRALVAMQSSAVFADSLSHANKIMLAVENGERDGDTYTLVTKNGSHVYTGLTPELISRAKKGYFFSLSGLTFTALQFAFGGKGGLPGNDQANR